MYLPTYFHTYSGAYYISNIYLPFTKNMRFLLKGQNFYLHKREFPLPLFFFKYLIYIPICTFKKLFCALWHFIEYLLDLHNAKKMLREIRMLFIFVFFFKRYSTSSYTFLAAYLNPKSPLSLPFDILRISVNFFGSWLKK